MSDFRSLAIVIHESMPDAAKVAVEIDALATARGIEVTVLAEEAALPENADLVVGVGGDGTLLRAVSLAHPADVPVIGVNLGTVGYLADVEPDRIEEVVDALVGNHVMERHRMTVTAELPGGERFDAINDVVLEKVMSQRVVQVRVDINDKHFTTFRADGLIVATPLGSTAYSLSAGGPILDPQLDALILTPVAPHSLLSRSIVLAPDAVLKFTVAIDRPVRVNLDGREAGVVAGGGSVTVVRGARPVRFLSLFGGLPFPQGVRRQFGLDHT